MNVDTGQFLALRGEVAGLGAAVEELDRRHAETSGGLYRVTSVLETLLTGARPAARHAAPGRHLRLVRDR